MLLKIIILVDFCVNTVFVSIVFVSTRNCIVYYLKCRLNKCMFNKKKIKFSNKIHIYLYFSSIQSHTYTQFTGYIVPKTCTSVSILLPSHTQPLIVLSANKSGCI